MSTPPPAGGFPAGPESLEERLAIARHQRDQEKHWYGEHGGSLEAYVERYGNPGEAHCHGDGGSAIHAADLAAWQRAEARVAALEDLVEQGL